jgi:ribosome-associated translation inhibitor RaiA
VEIPIDFLIRAGREDTVEALRQYAGRRLSYALRRFEHSIRRVSVRLVDVNGPRKGMDSRCSIDAELVGGRRVFVDAMAAWPFAAVTLAAARLNEAVRRDRSRLVEHRRRPAHHLEKLGEGGTGGTR